MTETKPVREQKLLHIRVSDGLYRSIRVFAAENDLSMNKAAVELFEFAIKAKGESNHNIQLQS